MDLRASNPNVRRRGERTAAIVGAGTSLGAAIARHLEGRGTKIDLADWAHDSVSDSVARAFDKSVILNPADPHGIGRFFSVACPPLDALINIVTGPVLPAGLVDLPLAEWRRAVAARLDGAFLCAQAAARRMRDQGGGRIVNVYEPPPTHSSPAQEVVRAGLVTLTRSLAIAWAPFRIIVNGVIPGLLRGHDAENHPPMGLETSFIPLGRLASPSEIAAVAAFLASPRCEYLVGQTLIVDGGASAATEYVGRRVQQT